nr:alpha/beta hydrolase [Alteraurantiacibacter aquimixticola]
MGTLTTKDGTEIFYKDWGPRDARPIVFHHGCPLSADDWDNQTMFFLLAGCRVIAHDRCGHGRSTQTDTGIEMETYAADVAALTDHLNLEGAVHVGHSTGGGVVTRYIARSKPGRVSKAVLIGAIPPIMLKTTASPGGLLLDVFDGFRAALAANRTQFYRDVASGTFLRLQPSGHDHQPGPHRQLVAARHDGRRQGALRLHQGPLGNRFHRESASHHGAGPDHARVYDQIVPIADSAELAIKLVKRGTSRPIRVFRMAWPQPNPKLSTPTCSPWSGADAMAETAGIFIPISHETDKQVWCREAH